MQSRASIVFLSLIVFLPMAVGQGREAHAEDPREMRARTAWAAGNYEEARDLYAALYAETLHPTYLRNIGRCHQNLGQPERAISSFREYLRKAPDLSSEERAEIETYIEEMKDLQKRQTAAATGPKVASPPEVTVDAAPAPDHADDDGGGVMSRWWFWTAVGVAIAAGVVGGVALSGGDDGLACPAGRICK